MLEKHYQYAQKAFPSLTEGSEFFPLWTAIGGHGYLKDWFSININRAESIRLVRNSTVNLN